MPFVVHHHHHLANVFKSACPRISRLLPIAAATFPRQNLIEPEAIVLVEAEIWPNSSGAHQSATSRCSRQCPRLQTVPSGVTNASGFCFAPFAAFTIGRADGNRCPRGSARSGVVPEAVPGRQHEFDAARATDQRAQRPCAALASGAKPGALPCSLRQHHDGEEALLWGNVSSACANKIRIGFLVIIAAIWLSA